MRGMWRSARPVRTTASETCRVEASPMSGPRLRSPPSPRRPARSRRPLLLGHSAACPVSVQKTSSSVGAAERRGRRSPIPAAVEVAHDGGQADERRPPPRPAKMATLPRPRGPGRPTLVLQRLRGQRPLSAPDGRERQLDPLAADLALELVGGAERDRAAVFDDGDSGRRGSRPPRGTGWSGSSVTPPATKVADSAPTSTSRPLGSSPVVGSSRNSTGGVADQRRPPRSRRRRMPPE